MSPITPVLGLDSWLGFGVQSAYETAVARTLFLHMIKGDLKAEKVRTQSVELGRATQKNHFKGIQKGSGSFSLMMHYDGLETILKQIHGKAPATSGPGPYQHIFDGMADSPLPEGLTLEHPLDPLGAMLGIGCFITKASFTYEPGQAVMLDIEVSAKDVSKSVSISTPVFPTFNPVESCDVVTLTLDGTTYAFRKITLNIELNLKTDQTLVGSCNPQHPYRDGLIEATVEVPRLLENTDFIDALDTGAEIPNLIIDTVGPGGAGVEQFTQEAPIVLVEGDTPAVDNPGGVEETVKLRLLDGATPGSLIKNTLWNATAAVT